VRIEVDPGGLAAATFDSVIQEITSAIPAIDRAVESASGGAARRSLTGPISDVAPVAALSGHGLGEPTRFVFSTVTGDEQLVSSGPHGARHLVGGALDERKKLLSDLNPFG
jgi:hypothetical protein